MQPFPILAVKQHNDAFAHIAFLLKLPNFISTGQLLVFPAHFSVCDVRIVFSTTAKFELVGPQLVSFDFYA